MGDHEASRTGYARVCSASVSQAPSRRGAKSTRYDSLQPGDKGLERPGGRWKRVAPWRDFPIENGRLTFNDTTPKEFVMSSTEPGRAGASGTTFTSSTELAAALRRAEVAHAEHEKRTGQRDAAWADWYAAYIVAERAGKPLPT